MGAGRARSKTKRHPERREALPRGADLRLIPAARIESLAGDPSFMTSLAPGLTGFVQEAADPLQHRLSRTRQGCGVKVGIAE